MASDSEHLTGLSRHWAGAHHRRSNEEEGCHQPELTKPGPFGLGTVGRNTSAGCYEADRIAGNVGVNMVGKTKHEIPVMVLGVLRLEMLCTLI